MLRAAKVGVQAHVADRGPAPRLPTSAEHFMLLGLPLEPQPWVLKGGPGQQQPARSLLERQVLRPHHGPQETRAAVPRARALLPRLAILWTNFGARGSPGPSARGATERVARPRWV